MSSAPSSTAGTALRDQVAAIEWYHTLELPGGIVTPGWLDHRPIVDQISLPASLTGQRCLDVATFNGFWAFELERRGASEVVALDVFDPRQWDWPAGSDEATVATISARMARGQGFDIARDALASDVQRVDRSVYALDPAEVGTFDFVYIGSLLLHLRDPIGALERVRAVCRGALVVVDGIDWPLTLRSPRQPVVRLDGRGRPWWWYPNAAGLQRMIEAAGFEVRERPRTVFVPAGVGWSPPRRNPRLLRSREGRHALMAGWRGDPHAMIVAQPRR